LAKTGHVITNLETDLADGIYLAELVSVLSMKTLQVNRAPRMKIQKLENVQKVLNFLKTEEEIRLVAITAEDIIDGRLKLILGGVNCCFLPAELYYPSIALDASHIPFINIFTIFCLKCFHQMMIISIFPQVIWTLVLKYQVRKTDKGDQENNSPKQYLLDWANKELSSVGLAVKNFTHDWSNGLAFCGLLSDLEADSIAFSELNPTESEKNLELAFKTAQEKLGMPQLLDASDIARQIEELSVMTYVATLKAHLALA
jgi:spectrin beta